MKVLPPRWVSVTPNLKTSREHTHEPLASDPRREPLVDPKRRKHARRVCRSRIREQLTELCKSWYYYYYQLLPCIIISSGCSYTCPPCLLPRHPSSCLPEFLLFHPGRALSLLPRYKAATADFLPFSASRRRCCCCSSARVVESSGSGKILTLARSKFSKEPHNHSRCPRFFSSDQV